MTTLIIAATEFELALLVETLQCRQNSRLLDFSVYQTDSSTDDHCILIRSGAGIANAAAATSLGIALYKPVRIFNVGVCGVYNTNMNTIGTVVTGTRAIFADTGIDTGTDFLSMQAIDLPLAKPESGDQVFNVIELHKAGVNRKLKRAVFLTVAACSGSSQRAAIVRGRFSFEKELLCEDMESAAVALMANKANIPCTIVRGISNICGDRDYGNWQLSKAAQAAQKEVIKCL